jgi:uncharacterized BrkB/YihY/UPF0761 family membrane protein
MFNKKPENLTTEELLWKIYKNTEKTRRYIFWGKIMSLIYLLLIIIPIILAIIYLPPMLEKVLQPYQSLLNKTNQSSDLLNQLKDLPANGLDLNSLLEVYKK